MKPDSWDLRGVALATLALGCVAVATGHGHAHHGSATSRASGGTVWWSGLGLDGAVSAPRLKTGLVYGGRSFGRVLDGGTAYAGSELGKVALHAVNLQVAIELETATVLGFQLGAGTVMVSDARGETNASSGLGDLELFVGQDLLTTGDTRAPSFALTTRAGLVMPTGHYARGARLSMTDLTGDADGSLALMTYNTQASLGAGTWTPLIGLGARIRIGPGSVLLVEGTYAQPLTRTRDGILWGADLTGRLAVAGTLMGSRLSITGGLAYRHHLKDEVPVTEAGAATRRDRVGGWDEVALALDLSIAVTRGVSCSAGLRVPIWQHVGGIQLVESVSGTAGCAVAWGL